MVDVSSNYAEYVFLRAVCAVTVPVLVRTTLNECVLICDVDTINFHPLHVLCHNSL